MEDSTTAPATQELDGEVYSELAVEIPEEPEGATGAAPQAPSPPTGPATSAPAPQASAPPQPDQAEYQPAQPPPPPTTDELIAKRNAWLEQLQRQYVIPDDQVDLLVTEPHKVLPQMAANIVANTYEAVVQYLNHAMPYLVQGMIQQHGVQRSETDRFFEAWPELKASQDPRLIPTVSWIAQGYRRMNPTASAEQAIQDVGRQAMAALNIARGANGRSSRAMSRSAQAPFSHAAPGVAAGPPAPEQRGVPVERNIFTELASIDLSEI